MKGRLLVLAAAAAMVCGPALAADQAVAQLGDLTGKIMVSAQGKVSPASAGALRVGDRVIASAGAKARVKFADGCVVNLAPASMLTVSAKSPCASGQGLVKSQPVQAMEDEKFFGLPAEGVAIGAALVAAAGNDSSSP